MKSNRFQELDMMRGFAACWVVGIHFWYWNILPQFFGYSHFFEYIKAVGRASTLAKFFPLPFNSIGNIVFDLLNVFFLLGYQGVHIFFILSGFGLTYSRILQPDESWIIFIKKKFVRLYPSYWILFAISLMVPRLRSDLFYGFFDWWSFWRSWIALDRAIPFSWFMFPLLQFYLCFFFLFKWLQKNSIFQFIWTAFLIQSTFTFLFLILSWNLFPQLLGVGCLAITRLFEFGLGMAMAKVYANNPTRLINYLTNPVTIALAIFLEILGILCTFKFSNSLKFMGLVLPFGISFYDAFLGFGIFVIVFNICRNLSRLSALTTKILIWLSRISYEIYLTQFIGLIIIPMFFTAVVRGERSILTAVRAILLYLLLIEICIVSAFLLQQLTKSIASQARLARMIFFPQSVCLTSDISETEQPKNHRIIILALIFLTLMGLGFRLYLAWRTNQYLPDTIARLRGDEPSYEEFAYNWLKGNFFQWSFRTPVYPLFVAGCYAIFGRSPASVVYVQAFLGAITIPLTFIMARRFTGAQNSLVAAGLIAIHPALILHSRLLLTEILYTPLIIVTILSLLRALKQPRWQTFATAGAVLAVTNLCRPTGMFLPAIVPLLMPREWHFKRKIALFVAYLSTIIIITAPWTYYNYRTHNTFLIYSVSTTGLLWQGSPEFYHFAYEKMPPRNIVQIWGEELNPARNGGHNVLTLEGDRYFTKRAIGSILREPGVYLWYCLQKVVFFWLGNPVSDWPYHAMFNVEVMRPFFSPQRILGILASRILPVFAALGMILLRHRWRDFLPLLAVCGYFTLLHALTYPEARYSEPLHPILAVIIAIAAGELQRRLKLISQ